MATAEYDLRYIREALDILESYLFSKEIFWNLSVNPPPGEAPYPAMTLGGILLAAARLSALEAGGYLQPAESTVWHDLKSQIDGQRSHWHTAWTQKAERSINARLTQWGNFLEDYRQNSNAHARRYAYEVRLRVMLELLIGQINRLSTTQEEHLKSLDLVLRHALRAGNFIWAEQLAGGFPPNPYWYLYGQLLTKTSDDA